MQNFSLAMHEYVNEDTLQETSNFVLKSVFTWIDIYFIHELRQLQGNEIMSVFHQGSFCVFAQPVRDDVTM